MKTLELQYRQYGYEFTQIKREGFIAIYEQKNEDTGKVIAYEIFEIQQLPEQYVGPKKYYQPARETPPGKEMWGRKGWTRYPLDHAMEKFNELCVKAKAKNQQ